MNYVQRARRHVAVVGAGMAGIASAETLLARGYRVSLVDKARGPGGRMTTRRVDSLAFDHGCPWLPARGGDFGRLQEAAQRAGILSSVQLTQALAADGHFTAWSEPVRGLVGRNGMSSLPRALCRDLDLRLNCRIEALERTPGPQWWLAPEGTGERLGPFDGVVVAVPAPQAVPLLDPHSRQLAEAAGRARMLPCWTVLVAFVRSLHLQAPLLWPEDSPIGMALCDSAKPGRARDPECWVLHAGPSWTRAHLEAPQDWVAETLLRSFADAIGRTNLPRRLHLAAHRWRHAEVEQPVGEVLVDIDHRLTMAGDWCLGRGVDAAYHSGRRAGLLMHFALDQHARMDHPE